MNGRLRHIHERETTVHATTYPTEIPKSVLACQPKGNHPPKQHIDIDTPLQQIYPFLQPVKLKALLRQADNGCLSLHQPSRRQRFKRTCPLESTIDMNGAICIEQRNDGIYTFMRTEIYDMQTRRRHIPGLPLRPLLLVVCVFVYDHEHLRFQRQSSYQGVYMHTYISPKDQILNLFHLQHIFLPGGFVQSASA